MPVRFLKNLGFLRGIAGISILDQGLISGINFILGIFLAYKLGIAAFGQYSLIILVVLFCVEMQRAIIISPMFIFSAKEGEEDYLQSLYPLQFIVAVTLSGIAGAFIHFSGFFFEKWQIAGYFLPAAVFTFVKMQHEFYRRYFFATMQPVKVLIIDTVFCLLLAIGLLVLYSEINIASILSLLIIVTLIPLLFFKIQFSLSPAILKTTIIRHYHFSKWLVASSFSGYLSGNLLLFIGSAIVGSSAAGILKLSQYIMGIMVILYQAIENIIPSRLAFFVHRGQTGDLKNYFYRYFRMMMAVTLLHGLFIYALLKPILFRINNGPFNAEQYHIAIGYILLSFFISITYSLQYLLRAVQQTRAIFIASLLSACMIILCGKTLIDVYGVIGILYGFFLSQFTILGVYLYFIRNVFHAHPSYPAR